MQSLYMPVDIFCSELGIPPHSACSQCPDMESVQAVNAQVEAQRQESADLAAEAKAFGRSISKQRAENAQVRICARNRYMCKPCALGCLCSRNPLRQGFMLG